MIKSKAKQNKTAKLVAYKKYCNKIIDLLKTSRQFDYQIYFKRYKNNSKILQQVINNIKYSNKTSNSPSTLMVNEKSITHPQNMAKHFNIFITSLGKEIQNNIPPYQKQFHKSS